MAERENPNNARMRRSDSSRAWGVKLRNIAGGLFLVLQLLMIARARFVSDRYFSWAPHDSQNEYTIETSVRGRLLTPDEIHARYGLPRKGVDPRAIEHVFDVVRHRERDAPDRALVEVRYRTNGRPEQSWLWPEP